MKNKIIYIIIALITSIAVTLFISGYIKYIEKKKVEKGKEKIKIVTTIFPNYDFTKNIAKEKAEVKLILPAGVEAHSFEPTSKDIIDINSSDILIYTGDNMEAWVKGIVKQAKDHGVRIVDVSKGINTMEDKHEHEDENEHDHEHDHDHHHAGVDPHIWTDPVIAKQMVKNILDELISIDEKNKEYYEKNANEYIKSLDKLDKDFKEMFSKKKNKKIIFAGHFPFAYFAKRYDLEYITPYSGFSPNQEPSAKKIIEMVDSIKKIKAKYIYHEELIEPKIAKYISEETGVKLQMLHGLHNLSKEERKQGKTYLDIMYENLRKIDEGLE